MARTTDWTPRGQRLVDHAPFGHWRRQTFVAAPRHNRLDAPWVMDGTMNRTMFDTYVETQLAPVLSKGDVIILDNLSSHKSQHAAGSGRMVLLPAAVLARSEPDRDGLLKAQNADRKGSRPKP